MGGKSRKSGGVSRQLIDKLKALKGKGTPSPRTEGQTNGNRQNSSGFGVHRGGGSNSQGNS